MKSKILLVALALASVATVDAKKNSDPVLMTVNGKKIPLSEFQYLYNKNNTQQSEKQSIDEYVDMFVTYKLKVADAEAAGIDTTAAFKKEFLGYRNELARPYLRDSTVYDRLVAEAYDRMKEDVDVSHIMVNRGESQETDAKNAAMLDSIRTAIINGADFNELALKYSIDPGVKRNQGHMGWMSANQYPYSFEVTAYNTPVGTISPVIQTDFGHHIVKVHGRRPARGEVLVQHILKLTQGRAPEQAEKQKQAIDSIYGLLKNGADFDSLAIALSEDPGSARNGGKLPWFGTGRMVPEFEEASFSLDNGQISEPFATSYGYHIVKKIDSKGVKSFDEAKEAISRSMSHDMRSAMPEKAKLDELKKEYKSTIHNSALEKVVAEINAHGKLDSAVVDKFRFDRTALLSVGRKNIPVCEVMSNVPLYSVANAASGIAIVKETANKMLDDATIEAGRDALVAKHPDYRNLVNEYRDGMLLFEVSNQNVWEKASKDKAGLEEYFKANRAKYNWDTPRFKGYIVFTPNDSVESAVKEYLKINSVTADSITTVMRREFGRDVKVERVIAAKGDNAIVDAVAFGAEKPEPTTRWSNYFAFEGRIIALPEEAADVRGAVTTDYQSQLEKEWVASLKSKYPVTINRKVLDKLK